VSMEADQSHIADVCQRLKAHAESSGKSNGVAHRMNGNGHDPASCWHHRADDLADWTERRMVNRRDMSGGYYLDGDGKVAPFTSKDALTRARIVCHYQATCEAAVLGLHTTSRIIHEPGVESCVSFWGAADIDQHGEVDFSEANRAAAIAWFDVLADLGFHPLLTDSNGKGGFHLRVLFEDPTVTAHVRQLFRWLVRDWEARGLEHEPEVFPKQPEIAAAGNGSCGNWLRLPARHPKRDHWSRVWDGSEWLEGDDAIDFMLDLSGDSARLIPNEALVWKPEGGRQTSSRASEPKSADDVGFAREALGHLGAGAKDQRGREFLSEYSSWLTIGMALFDLGDVGLELWEGWSKQSTKYEPGGQNSCSAKWETFKAAGDNGVSLGTLYHHAKANGWPGFPKGPEMVWPAADGVNEAADDPHRLARIHLAKFVSVDLPALRCYRGEWLGWSSGAYRPIGEAELQAGLTGTIKGEFDRLNQLAVDLWEHERGKSEDAR
jgi:putative DNA primase/helicase